METPDSTQPESWPTGPSFYSSPDQVALEFASIVKFMREDSDHLVFRRFERLNLYNLLLLQHRLAVYDEQISIHEDDWDGPALAEMLPKLEPLMKSYNEAFLAQEKMRKIQSTPEHLAANLRKHARSALKQLKHELEPQEGWSELSSLGSSSKGWIHKFVDKNDNLSKLFRKAGTEYAESGLFKYSEIGVRIAEQTIVNATFCILILAPIFALSFITNNVGKLFLVLASVLLVSFTSSILSDNAQKGSLGLVVGYTAILVVFLSNGNSNSNAKGN